MKLSGWNRLAIVIYGLYCTSLFVVGVLDYSDKPKLSYKYLGVSAFTRYVDTTKEYRENLKIERDERHLKCKSSPDVLINTFCGAIYSISPNYIKRLNYFGLIFVFIFIPVVFFLLVKLLMFTYIWVKSGFKHNA